MTQLLYQEKIIPTLRDLPGEALAAREFVHVMKNPSMPTIYSLVMMQLLPKGNLVKPRKVSRAILPHLNQIDDYPMVTKLDPLEVREWYFAWAKKNIIPTPDELPDAPLVMHGTKFRSKKRKQQVVEVDEEFDSDKVCLIKRKKKECNPT